MTEVETIAYTKAFIDKMASGINPLTGERLPEADLLNNVRISRCLYLVSDYLRQIIENGGFHVDAPRRAAPPFDLPPDAVARFPFSETPMTVQDIVNRLYDLAGQPDMAALHPQSLVTALKEAGLLTEEGEAGKQKHLAVTDSGTASGIRREDYRGPGSVYQMFTFDIQAQALILDMLPRILEIDRAV